MYSSIRRYSADPSQIDELMHRIDAQFCSMIEDQPGFVAYQALDCGEGTCVTVTTFRDRDSAEASLETAAGFIRDSLSDIPIERVDARTGEAKVSRAVAEMLEPAHA
jgi:hypothetical protein